KDSKKSTICNNCKKKGHTKEQCWKEGGGKAGQGPKWFLNKTKKGKEMEKAATAATAASTAAYTKTYDHALLAGEGLNSHEETTLFDSGASHHMSSYRSQFLDYKPIIPKPITAADNHTFHTIRKGDLMISLPNGKGHSRIHL
ncbi:hypothetical protein SCLCIDRAFT_137957, partial [Scleroderma citrinum Foug A]